MFTKKKIIIGVIFIVAVGGFFFYRSRTSVEVVQTETVKQGDVIETVSVTGELAPAEYADLSFRRAGAIDRVFLKEGDMVALGDRIVSLDQSVLLSQLRESRIALAIVVEDEKLARHGWDNLKQ